MLPSGKTGFLLDAPEYLAVYDGATGQEIDRVPWIELGNVRDWGDYTGNRASRHMLATAYLDGKTPAVLVGRGTYGQMKIDAYVLQNKKLRKVWRWTNEQAPFMYQGQGQHTIKTGDIDGDGCDEIINGSLAIDHDGRTLWCTGLGHGDRSYMGDIDPDRPGWEIWYIIEEPHPRNGACLVDARTRAYPVRRRRAHPRQRAGRVHGRRHRPRPSGDGTGRRHDSTTPPKALACQDGFRRRA